MTFRYPVQVQRLNENEEWEDFLFCHAHVNGLGGSEYWAARAVQAENTVTFEARYCRKLAALSPQTCRILFDGCLYDVQSIDDFEFRHQTLKFKGVRHYGQREN